MSSNSRREKYSRLHQEIAVDQEVQIDNLNRTLQDFITRMERIDPAILQDNPNSVNDMTRTFHEPYPLNQDRLSHPSGNPGPQPHQTASTEEIREEFRKIMHPEEAPSPRLSRTRTIPEDDLIQETRELRMELDESANAISRMDQRLKRTQKFIGVLLTLLILALAALLILILSLLF